MARARTKAGLKTNALGTARPFIAGLENPRITPLDALAWQAFTEVSGLNVEKTESTTITLPSDNDGFNYDEVTISYGGFQDQTFTLTEYMDERGNAPYLDAMITDAPGSLWLPEGRNRRLSDPYDFQSGILIDKFTVSADTKDDNANPSDGDPGNPNKISATGNFHGRNRHVVKPITLTSSTLSSSAAGSITGVSFAEERETNAGIGRVFYALEAGKSGAVPLLHKRDAYGIWDGGTGVGSTANAQELVGLSNAGTHFMAVAPVFGASPGSETSSSYAIPVDNIGAAVKIGHGALSPAGETQVPLSVWAKSGTEIWYTYGHFAAGSTAATSSTGALGKASSPTSAPVSKLQLASTDAASSSRFYAIHGLNDQLVAGGGTGGTGMHASRNNSVAATNELIIHNADQDALIYTSDDNGETWDQVTAPSTHATTGTRAITSVFMTDADTFFIGTSDGQVWFTHDFGTTWTRASVDAGMQRIVKIVFYFPDGANEASRLGYLLGKRSSGDNFAVYRSIDGGRNWVDRRSLMAASNSDVSLEADTSTGSKINGGPQADIAVAGPQSVILGGIDSTSQISVR